MKKTKLSHRIIAIFLTLNFLTTIVPVNLLFANNNGPNAPEASNFEPVSATDMVNLSSGDMSYVLPLLEIDGFPVTLSYHAGIPMDMEASWVGLGWNINTGAISRGIVSNPDDWNDGKRLNLTYLYGEQDSYSVDVGVGVTKAAEVGIGLSWGPNKSLSGSVSASIGPLSASMDTNGNYSVGVGAGAFAKNGFEGIFDKIGSGKRDGNSPFGGGLSISGNVNEGGISANVGVGGSGKHVSASMGIAISGNGIGGSYSVGGNNNMRGTDNRSGGAGISMNSFSAGDYSYNSSGFYVPISIGVLSFGFGFNRTKITVEKAFQKHGYGVLYHASSNLYDDTNTSAGLGENVPDSGAFTDYKKRNEYGDVYEQALPQTEEEFIGDYRSQIEKLNFTFNGYDSYNINATGVAGTLRPIVGQNTSLSGEGYDGASIRLNRDKTKVFYHHGTTTLKQTKTLSAQNLHYVFDGQITQNALNSGHSIINKTGSNLNLSQFINKGTYSISSRPKAGSYVEVFTNSQIDSGASILTPASLFVQGSNPLTRASQGYMADGIGGYKITTPDGKTYHFAQPVYHYEQIQHNYLNFPGTTAQSPLNSSTKREATPYATHWLLTAITGPDFIDKNSNNFPDESDYGYWVRLDHGRWSNAYTWRSPYDNGDFKSSTTKRHYATFIDKEVEKSDPGYFLQGRKDLYYLDKIVSKAQTAYFVKDVRYDGIGTGADYFFNLNSNVDDQLNNESSVNPYENAIYNKEYQLYLDKIVIVNNKPGTAVSSVRSPESLASISAQTLSNRYSSGKYFYNNLGSINRTHKLHQSNKVIDKEDFQNFDYSKAQKVIKFDYDYLLAQQTPSSEHTSNPNKGRLTLNSVKTYGRATVSGANESQLSDYMPPYEFTYHKPTKQHEENYLQALSSAYNHPSFPNKTQYKLVRSKKDNWGFRENDIEAWSLASIKTPLGATIDVEYEEDDYYIEAFGRRYWENNLQFTMSRGSNYFELKMEQENGNSLEDIDFRDYFDTNKPGFLDFWFCSIDEDWQVVSCSQQDYRINIPANSLGYDVYSVTDDIVTFRFNLSVVEDSGDSGDIENKLFSKNFENFTGTYSSENTNRKECIDHSGCGNDTYNLVYKILANKVPPGTSGGGLRVKKIVVDNGLGNQNITSYDYSDPNTGETSGITSYNPVHGEVFVPYQNELPGPGVMYEWVTMTASSINHNDVEEDLSSIRYHFHTLKPIYDIFNPDIDMKDEDGKSIFKTTVTEPSMSLANLTAKNINIEKDLSKIGQLISTEEFNAEGQLMNKSVNTYGNRVGELSETFSSMKSVFDFDEDSNGNSINHLLVQRYLAQSTKSEKVSVVQQIDNYAGGAKSTVEYSNPDEYLGTFTTSIRSMSDGTKVKEAKIPAYTKYAAMGAKVDNANNKNMLTQEAMNISSVDINGTWKTLNANISTWEDTWTYRDNSGTETTESGVWRKYKNYVWKEDVNTSTGAYNTTITENSNYFNWSTGTPTNSKWQNPLEITRYTHWSSPVETKDINGNFAASKMGDNFSKVTAGGNARYSEIYYCGAEYVVSGNTFEGEVLGANYRQSVNAHTGSYSVKTNSANSKVFEVAGNVGTSHSDISKDFRPGKYKVSFWMYHPSLTASNQVGAALKLNGVNQALAETVEAGSWKQYNYYVTLSANTSVNLYATNTSAANYYFDDFRMHPVYASLNSYVYDQDTDELTHILDANNLATKYVYDPAGRLCKTYAEVVNDGSFTGGFKLTSKNEYYYKGLSNPDCGDCCDNPPLP